MAKTKTAVGVIGLGIIGSRVAAALRSKDFPVYVWNRSPRREPNFLGSASEVVKYCNIIQIFAGDDEAVLSVVDHISQALTPGHIVMNHATVSVETTRLLHEKVLARKGRFLDAPFTGSRSAAQSAELVYYIGGDEAVLKEVRPVLEASSKAIIPIGGVGDATVVKLATNMVSATSVQVLAEALALVEGSKISPQKLVDALAQNANRSSLTDAKLPQMIAENYDPNFSLKHMLKDMRHALHEAELIGIDLPATRTSAALLFEGQKEGWGGLDFCVVARHYFPERKEEKEAEIEELEAEEFAPSAVEITDRPVEVPSTPLVPASPPQPPSGKDPVAKKPPVEPAGSKGGILVPLPPLNLPAVKSVISEPPKPPPLAEPVSAGTAPASDEPAPAPADGKAGEESPAKPPAEPPEKLDTKPRKGPLGIFRRMMGSQLRE